MFVVESAQSLAVVYGLAHDNHGGQRELVLSDDLGQLTELTAIDALVFPRQPVAYRHGRFGGIASGKQFIPDLRGQGDREKDTHRTLMSRQEAQAFALGNGCAPFASGKDNRLG